MFKSRLMAMMALSSFFNKSQLRVTPHYMRCQGGRVSVANRGSKGNKYKPHQGAQECARRVRQHNSYLDQPKPRCDLISA